VYYIDWIVLLVCDYICSSVYLFFNYRLLNFSIRELVAWGKGGRNIEINSIILLKTN